MKNKGFTLTETLIATAVVGVLAAIAVPSYSYYINSAQISEAFKLMDAQRININQIHRTGSCTALGRTIDTYKGKYGLLTISGVYTPSEGKTCPSGCTMSYTYNSTGVSKGIAGKIISAQILNNGKISKISGSTDVPEQYLPKEFRTIGVATGDVCTRASDDPLVPTTGTAPTGTETGASAPPPSTTPNPPVPSTPTPPPSTTPNPPTPSTPTPPPSTTPNPPTPSTPTPPPSTTPNPPAPSTPSEQNIPVDTANWIFETRYENSSENIKKGLANKLTGHVIKYNIPNGKYFQNLSDDWASQMDTKVTINLGVNYANKSITGTLQWGYVDTGYPDKLSDGERINISTTADNNGIVTLNTFESRTSWYSDGDAFGTPAGTTYHLVLNSGGATVHVSGLQAILAWK